MELERGIHVPKQNNPLSIFDGEGKVSPDLIGTNRGEVLFD